MRNWLAWIVGFALCFAAVFGFLLVVSLSSPSLWLPIAFGIAFYGLLTFGQRLEPVMRAGMALLFASVSSLLWIVSGDIELDHRRQALQTACATLLWIPVVVGLLTIVIVALKPSSRPRPAIWPAFTLMFLGWLISYFSSTHGGASPMVDWVVRHLHVDRHTAEIAVVAFRKTVHFTFYGLVALAGLLTAARNGAVGRACVLAALMTTVVYASFDELRQSSQPDRTGSVWDVLLDLTGGSVALGAVYALRTTKHADRPKPIPRNLTN